MHRTPGEACTDLIFTYAERIDAGDFVGVGELLAHATMTFEGMELTVKGAQEITRLYEGTTRRYENGTPNTKHVMTNVLVDVDDDALAATSRSYFTVLQAVPNVLALQPVVAGRYRHRFRCAEGQWRIEGMHIMIDLMGDVSQHLLIDLAP